ncbi:hypothetical protein AB0G86_41145 [Streptomyces scabiei]|uniref:hypothetical protein n=1 Tax=Streptomyces scabiei TaxID=1930 RepID=UPI0033C19F34
MCFAVLGVGAQLDRNCIRQKTLEGQAIAAAKGNHDGRPKVIDDDMITFALALKAKGVPIPEIAGKLTIKTGKNAGKSPSVASLYRALAEAEEADAPTETLVVAPADFSARITGPGSGMDPELMERLTRQALDGNTDQVLADLVRQTEDDTSDAVLADLVRQSEDGTNDVVLQLLAKGRSRGNTE